MIANSAKAWLTMHTIQWTVLLTIFWLLLSGIYTPLLLSFGAVSVAIVIFILRRMDAVDKEQQSVGLGPGIIRYFPWLIGQILSSSIDVTKLIWGAKSKISPTLVKFNVETIPQELHVLYANSITLTPGTLCVDLDDGEITVHALQKTSITALEQGYIAQQIKSNWDENK